MTQQFIQPGRADARRLIQSTFDESNCDNDYEEGNPMTCACGCGEVPVNGKFLPGHDQKLRADLERRVGGLIPLRMLVEAAEYFVDGSINSSMFNSMVKDVFEMKESSK